MVKTHFGPKSSSNASFGIPLASNIRDLSLGLDTGCCKVFLESEDVGRTLDLSVLGSYEELYRRLVSLFGIERSDVLSHVLYEDAMGVVREAGNEPFRLVFSNISPSFTLKISLKKSFFTDCFNFTEMGSDFIRKAKRLTIMMDSSRKNIRR